MPQNEMTPEEATIFFKRQEHLERKRVRDAQNERLRQEMIGAPVAKAPEPSGSAIAIGATFLGLVVLGTFIAFSEYGKSQERQEREIQERTRAYEEGQAKAKRARILAAAERDRIQAIAKAKEAARWAKLTPAQQKEELADRAYRRREKARSDHERNLESIAELAQSKTGREVMQRAAEAAGHDPADAKRAIRYLQIMGDK